MKGMLRTKAKVYCTVCGSSLTRNVSVETENNAEAIENAKAQLIAKVAKPYTCRICTSILKG